MKRDIDESLKEILIRSEKIRRERRNRVTRLLMSACAVLLVTLIAGISYFAGPGGSPVEESVYGSFLLSAKAGGYLLTAVISFIFGILAAVVAQRIRNNKMN